MKKPSSERMDRPIFNTIPMHPSSFVSACIYTISAARSTLPSSAEVHADDMGATEKGSSSSEAVWPGAPLASSMEQHIAAVGVDAQSPHSLASTRTIPVVIDVCLRTDSTSTLAERWTIHDFSDTRETAIENVDTDGAEFSRAAVSLLRALHGSLPMLPLGQLRRHLPAGRGLALRAASGGSVPGFLSRNIGASILVQYCPHACISQHAMRAASVPIHIAARGAAGSADVDVAGILSSADAQMGGSPSSRWTAFPGDLGSSSWSSRAADDCDQTTDMRRTAIDAASRTSIQSSTMSTGDASGCSDWQLERHLSAADIHLPSAVCSLADVLRELETL